MEKYENMTNEELKLERIRLCHKRSAIDAKLDKEAFGNVSDKDDLESEYEEALKNILQIDNILREREKNKNINRR